MQEPTHKTKYSAGADLSASRNIKIPAGRSVAVPTGYRLPDELKNRNLFYLLSIRSSLSYDEDIMLTNGIGVIDSDHPHEVKVMLYNPNEYDIPIEKGQRIAQLIPMQYVTGVFSVEDKERTGGFGSTNI